MEPSEILELTIKCLQDAVNKMMTFEWHKEIAKLPEAEKKAAKLRLADCQEARLMLENAQLKDILAQLEKNKEALEAGTKRVNEALENLKEVKEVLDAASSLLSIVAKVVAVAANPLAIVREIMRARSDNDLRRVKYSLRDTELFEMEAESFLELEMPPKSSIEEKAPLFLIEEVLHGVELTREKLIITVVSGGCTKEGDFRFDVNKRTTPYMVTVYRIVPDDCKRVPELIHISYSREELGLDGHVEFILRNKIGNTSQHRLDRADFQSPPCSSPSSAASSRCLCAG